MKREILTQVVRRCAPELLIGVAVCVGAMILLVDPTQKKLAEANAKVSDLQRSVAKLRTSPGALVDAQSKTQDAKDALDAIAARGQIVTDRTEMFRTLMNAAEASGVRVDQFQPSTPRGPRKSAAPVGPALGAAPGLNEPASPVGMQMGRGAAPTSAPAVAAKQPSFESRSSFALTVKGDYAAIARFVSAIQQDVAFSIIRSIRISPGAGVGDHAESLHASIETEHLALDTKAFLAAKVAAGSPAALPGAQASVPTGNALIPGGRP